ncbi:protein-disulfide reductase DsbD family protein [Pseudobacteriovorax antillogorgiicola]|uniref:Thiol:disulfide interchange protein DsbD n=1 Tax=Pseudobacteriovorax antillogorgiicola TaxID=1513793 RepID=A0A1Y6BTL5_9BACT|nr:cytochrome c biogenesis protein CcdA [Pseudobacteriovorax antillogorgiicola]TCS53900.1 thiol:disulfide interchange protein DsbD [Pseudobacteriovorax antillogorgiicola]SMF20778.1 thiol:disulfide interchange protein DsbD [Pseudobacteriovorax antillogorgiicola]
MLRKSMLLLTTALFLMVPSSSAFSQFTGDLGDQTVDLDLKPTDVILWSGVDARINQAGVIELGLRLETRQNFTIYADKLKVEGPEGTKIINKSLPDTRRQVDPVNGGMVDVFFGGDFIFQFSSLEPYQAATFPVQVTFLGCTERICLFPYTLNLELPVFKDETEVIAAVKTNDQITEGSWTATEGSVEEEFAQKLEQGALPLWLLLIVVFLGGLATNLTPCVFPMIPITIRLLGRQGETAKSSSILYALGIVVTYTAIGSIVAATGGLFGSLLANPVVNAAFGILFIGLGLSMLGFVNFAKLQTIGNQLGSGKSSRLNTFLMGTGAGLVAAPCTGPILGALLIYSAKLNDPRLSLGLFTLYSIGFALPYVFLGMAASKVTKLQVSPKIQVGVKVAFAGIMFALALYYLKTPAYQLLQPVQGYWQHVAIGSFIAFGVLSFLVAGVLRQENNKGLITLPTAFLGIALFGVAQILTGGNVTAKLDWLKTETAGYEMAAEKNLPVLVDGWADWCVACREMDATIFQDQEVISELQKNWVLIKLDLTEINDENEALVEKYNMPGLPTLVLVPSNGDLSKSVRIAGAVSKERLLKELRQFSRN